MFLKLLRVLKKIIYKLRFGNQICFDGFPNFKMRSQIYIKNGKVETGKNFMITEGAYIAAVDGGNISIGNGVHVNRNSILVSRGSISIGDNCGIGPNVGFYDHDHNFDKNGRKFGYKTGYIIIEENCWIGAGVTILRNTHIGKGSVIGAGCVVQGIIPSHSLVTSNRELSITPIIDREI